MSPRLAAAMAQAKAKANNQIEMMVNQIKEEADCGSTSVQIKNFAIRDQVRCRLIQDGYKVENPEKLVGFVCSGHTFSVGSSVLRVSR